MYFYVVDESDERNGMQASKNNGVQSHAPEEIERSIYCINRSETKLLFDGAAFRKQDSRMNFPTDEHVIMRGKSNLKGQEY